MVLQNGGGAAISQQVGLRTSDIPGRLGPPSWRPPYPLGIMHFSNFSLMKHTPLQLFIVIYTKSINDLCFHCASMRLAYDREEKSVSERRYG